MSSIPKEWQLGCQTLQQRGEFLFKTRQWSDCTFLVGTDINQDIVFGHKVVLAMASPVFEVMFYGVMAESNKPIQIVDVQKDVFQTALQYIYTGNISISTIDIACELYYAAKKYMLPHLIKQCTEYLVLNLCPNNVCRVYEFASLMEENGLMKTCIKLFKRKTKTILKESSFVEAKLDTVITIFSLDKLNIDSELDLFEAALRYETAMEKRNVENTTPSTEGSSDSETLHNSLQSSTPQVENIGGSTESIPDAVAAVKATIQREKPLDTEDKEEKPSIRRAVEKIRFLTLPPSLFTAGPACSRLLSDSEALHILLHILDSKSNIPFPPNFSSSKINRCCNPYRDYLHRSYSDSD